MEQTNQPVKGYKVFNPDWTCRGFQYEVGKTFEEDVTPECCEAGFHFCTKASDCFNYYNFDSNNKVAEVLALGEVDSHSDNTKCCTNKIQIVREISWQELLTIVNTGKSCTGLCNTGDCNTGDRNTGDWNTGNRNTGNRNTGDWNTGDCNTGNRNTGDWNTGNWNTGNRNTGDWNTGNRNTGDRNTGNRNTGDWNTGDWNIVNASSGCFCTEDQKILIFDKPSDWTLKDWRNSNARRLLNQIPKSVVEWIYKKDMIDKEKEENPTYKTTGGYLKVLDESESAQIWWDGLEDEDKNTVKLIPNFDAEKFEKCTGIKVGD
nr:MAG TPA: pentapeptide repeat protein [Caudoviricetes sp.]